MIIYILLGAFIVLLAAEFEKTYGLPDHFELLVTILVMIFLINIDIKRTFKD